MTKTPWTPGPWPVTRTGDGKRHIIGKGLVEGPNGYEVAEVYSDDCDKNEAAANARLIAEAPAMAEALEQIEQMVDYGQFSTAQTLIAAILARIKGETP